jgi:hypothetical protein
MLVEFKTIEDMAMADGYQFGVRCASRRGAGNGKQRIGHASVRRNNDHGFAVQLTTHYFDSLTDGCYTSNRGATELHNDHGRIMQAQEAREKPGGDNNWTILTAIAGKGTLPNTAAATSAAPEQLLSKTHDRIFATTRRIALPLALMTLIGCPSNRRRHRIMSTGDSARLEITTIRGSHGDGPGTMPFRLALAAHNLPFSLESNPMTLPWGETMALADSHPQQKVQLRAKPIKPEKAPGRHWHR